MLVLVKIDRPGRQQHEPRCSTAMNGKASRQNVKWLMAKVKQLLKGDDKNAEEGTSDRHSGKQVDISGIKDALGSHPIWKSGIEILTKYNIFSPGIRFKF